MSAKTRYKLYDGEVELDFNEKKHTYQIDGEIIPSVTGICKVIDKSGPLMWWAVGCALDYVRESSVFTQGEQLDEIDENELFHDAHRAHFRASKRATDIGSLAHEWIEQFLAGNEQPMPKNKELRSTIESWLEWAKTQHIEPYETEFKVFSVENDYAGTCDFDGMVGDEHCIVDWKTGKAVYPEHRFQTIAYKDAREEELAVQYDARWVIVLPKDGGKIIAERFGPECDEVDRAGFLGALRLHRSLQAIKDGKKS